MSEIYPLTLEDLFGEIWRDIKNYEDYQVSNFGRVKSFKFGKERILKPTSNTDGYLCVGLCKDGKMKTCKIHRLVAEAFVPNPKNLPEVDHIDTNKLNCRVENLRWATGEENRKYAVEAGLIRPKLTQEQVRCVRKNPKGLTLEQLAEKFGISLATVSRIQLGQSYKNAGGKIREARKRNCLTDEERAEICRLYLFGSEEFGSVALGIKFGVDQKTILNIVHGR